MAESNKFGNPRTQFGDTASGGQTENTHCAQCEAMLADALDGTLSATDQAMFDSHMATCGPCSQLLAEARRGLAWLEMLRDPQPEPPEMLVEPEPVPEPVVNDIDAQLENFRAPQFGLIGE